MIDIDYKKAKEYEFYVNPTLTSYGTLPPFLAKSISRIKPFAYTGGRPRWYPNAESVRRYLMEEIWGMDSRSRSLKWVIGHNGSPLSEDSIQIDHIIKWQFISEKLRNCYAGKNAVGSPWEFRTQLPISDNKLIKGIDYIDEPYISARHGKDILYQFTNIAAIKYFHTIENLRPLPGSLNARRNSEHKTDEDLGILYPERIDIELMNKLAELSAKCEEYISQVVHELNTSSDEYYRKTLADKFIDITDNVISSIESESDGLFI